jgi:asparagine synthetase B (glutamine-hydrolysing)
MLLIASRHSNDRISTTSAATTYFSRLPDISTRHATIYHSASSDHVVNNDGTILIRYGERTQLSQQRASEFSTAETRIYRSTVSIQTDLLATFPIYYYLFGSVLIISSTLSAIQRLTNPKIDHIGILQFLHHGYFVGSRTCLVGVQRTCAGQKLSINLDTGRINVRETSTLWSEDERPVTSDTIDELIALIGEHTVGSGQTMLMASGGWDSRTLLAAASACGQGNIKQLYFHGAIDSREAKITASLAANARIPINLEPLSLSSLTSEDKDDTVSHDDNMIFPYWRFAGHRAARLGCGTVAAGIYGEILGGHYGPLMSINGPRRHLNVLLYTSNPHFARRIPIPHALNPSQLFHYHAQKPWYLGNDAHTEWQTDYNHGTREDVEASIRMYRDRGIRKISAIHEAFITEHRGAQYIAAQLRACCRDTVQVAFPFAQTRVMNIATRIPYAEKLHNTLSRRIVERCAPELLTIPHAAALVPARHPIFIQELSRTFRKINEEMQRYLHDVTHGLVSAPNLSWVNFSPAMRDDTLARTLNQLKGSFWDKKSMARVLSCTSGGNAHPIFDMAGRIRTIDRMVAGS